MKTHELYYISNLDYHIVWKNEPEFGDKNSGVSIKLAQFLISFDGENWYVTDMTDSKSYESINAVYYFIYFTVKQLYDETYGNDFETLANFSFGLINTMSKCTIKFDCNGKLTN